LRRLVLDQGLPRSTAKILAARGWDVAHTGDIGLSQATDEEILTYAARERRACVTLDADFHALIAVHQMTLPSTIRIRIQGLKGDGLADIIERAWPHIEEAVEAGALVTVSRGAIRVRRLPITPR
jgi:predicted nuclease of predicted toxin-antitoxin system